MTTIRLDNETKKDLDFISKELNIERNENRFYSDKSIIQELIKFYLDSKKLDIKRNITKKEIIINDNILKRRGGRLDTNLPIDMRDDLKSLAEALLDNKIVSKKPTYIELMRMMFNKYLEVYPDLGEFVLYRQHIKQQLELNRLKEEQLGRGRRGA